MSALAAPPSARLRAVVAASAEAAPERPETGAASRRRGHLRLVTPDFVPEVPARRGTTVPVPSRRPIAPRPATAAPDAREQRAARAAIGAIPARRAAVATRAAELAPNHPAVRAEQRRAAARAAAGRTEVPTVASSVAESRTAVAAPRSAAVPPALRLLAAVAAVVLAAAAAVAIAIVAAGLVSGPVTTTTTTVQSGQSLWEVAAATGSDDVAETVAQIVELNDLPSSTIQAGQTLVVPVG